jgi:prolyl oligopeptidase
MSTQNNQPIAPIQSVTDNYFGIDVVDNYRYLEDFDNEAVKQWVKDQADFTVKTLAESTECNVIFNRLMALDASTPAKIFGIMQLANGKIFYFKQSAQEDVAKIYSRDSINSAEILLVDPDKFRQETGKIYTINEFKPSWDGRYLIYIIAANGSEDSLLYIINIETLEAVDRPISRIAGFSQSICWFPDSQSFFYHRLQELTKDMAATEKYKKSRTYLHRIGTDIEEDEIALAHGVDPLVNTSPIIWPYIPTVSNSGYAIALLYHGTQRNIDLYVSKVDLHTQQTSEWIKICDAAVDEVRDYVVHEDNIYLLTSKNAAHFKIIKASLSKPDLSIAENVFPESDLIIRSVFAASDALYVIATENGIGKVVRITYDGNTEKLRLPFDGTVKALKNDPNADGIVISIAAWTQCDTSYQYNPTDDLFTEILLQPKGKYDAPNDLVSKELTIESHDGIMVPLSIVYRKGLELDGTNPCWLVGYGSYGFPFDPVYRQTLYAWYEQGGILAVAHVRGGGENGEGWYRGGFQQTKPNTWKDFIACAEYLIERRYTSSSKLAGEGISAGGILIGRAITERPDLFAVAILRVGVLNSLRFETTPNGQVNIAEFGSCDTKEGFQSLYEMDAFLHICDGVKYPAMLITHGINDPRVEPWQSAKFTAGMQSSSVSGKPILLRMDYEVGHGIGSTKTQQLQERADIFAFMMWQFGMVKSL